MIKSDPQAPNPATTMPEVSHDVLELQLTTLNQNITHVMQSIDEMRDELKKISVLEVNHTHQNAALGRAFDEIKKLQDAAALHHNNDRAAHSKYDKTISFASGFVMAVSVFWTVFGVRMNSAIDDVVKTSIEMRIHMHEDKIRTVEDVHRALRAGKDGL